MHPGLAKLVDSENGETLKDLASMSPEDLLIRWVNYHLANAGTNKRIKNFSDDIKVDKKINLISNLAKVESREKLLLGLYQIESY